MKKRFLVMDVEGTIFKASFRLHGVDYKSTLWQPIARELGDAAMEEENRLARIYETVCSMTSPFQKMLKLTLSYRREEVFPSLI